MVFFQNVTVMKFRMKYEFMIIGNPLGIVIHIFLEFKFVTVRLLQYT